MIDDVGAAISCTSLALADSGIELFGLVAAASVCSSSSSSSASSPSLILDPTLEEQTQAGGGSMSIALMPSSGEVTQIRHEGRCDASAMDAALELANDG